MVWALLSLQMVKFNQLERESQHPRPVGINCRLNSSAPVGGSGTGDFTEWRWRAARCGLW